MSPLTSMIPKLLVAILALCIVYQLYRHETESAAAQRNGPLEAEWFQDARKAHQDKDEEKAETSSVPSVDYKRLHISYGYTRCMPAFDSKLKELAAERTESCAKHAPFITQETRRVALASITTGKPVEAYQRSIRTQMFHSAVHKSPIHILCEQLMDGAWNKIGFLLNLLMNEMLKPPASRLEWIMWMDRDAIILDPCRPLSAFLPPDTPEFEHINLVTNHDHLGLNAGVFLFRVNDWSIELFNTILAFRNYRPEEDLEFAEQSAMEKVIEGEDWADAVVRVPWYWFNAYPDEVDSVEVFKGGNQPQGLEWFRARKGDFAVHFAGDDGRGGRMLDWLDMLEELGNVWENAGAIRDVTSEIQKYWKDYQNGELTEAQISGEPQ